MKFSFFQTEKKSLYITWASFRNFMCDKLPDFHKLSVYDSNVLDFGLGASIRNTSVFNK